MQAIDWESLAKDPGKSMSPGALRLRNEARRAALSAVAPVHIINRWYATAGDRARVLPMTGRAARGVLAAIKEGLPHEHYLRVWRDVESLRVTASQKPSVLG